MSNKNLFKEAIADAKAVREAALANAKAALEEALTPKLQSMLAAKLNEMEYEEEGLEGDETQEEGFASSHEENNDANLDFNLEEDDFDLSEILAELDEEEENINEAKEEEEEEESEEEEGGEESEEENVADMSIEDLKALIADIVAQEVGNEGGEEMHAEPDADNAGGPSDNDADNADDEIDLEELLAELDALDESNDEDLNEIKRKDAKKKEDAKKKDEKKEIDEAIATINTLRSELNEVNLLNAKLLYVNKIFKAKNLNESQKLKVIAQFDKATTAKEAKTIFESMSTAIAATSKKSALKESIGFASKAAGVAPKKNIVEVDETMSRWQMLAGIKKF